MRTNTGNRLYTQDDIARLALIKHLVDAGDAIGAVASLSLTDLEKRLGTIENSVRSNHVRRDTLRIAAVGHAIAAHIARHKGELGDLDVVGIFHDAHHLHAEVQTCSADVVVVETPYVNSDTASEIEQLIDGTGAGGAVIIYGFGSRRHVQRLRMLPVLTLRAPADMADLKRACLEVCNCISSTYSNTQTPKRVTSSKSQPRRYDDDKLAQIATISTTIECECPHHLADLVFSLVSFEQYSAACANKNEDDAAMHRYLNTTAAQARLQLETALARLVEFEGLEV